MQSCLTGKKQKNLCNKFKGTDESGTVQSHINIGSGVEVSIKELAVIIAKVVGYKGEILWDTSKPDGTMRKLMDSFKIKAFEWEAKTTLECGIQSAYADYIYHSSQSENEAS